MKRRLLIVLLGFGTIFGFGTGFASMSHHWHHRAEQRRANFESHVADVCVEAAQRADERADERADRRAERRADPRDRWDEPPSDYPDWDDREWSDRRHHRPHRGR